LAHEVNNIPYSDDSLHLDIIEIDAASNRRIDEIRELRDKVHISPTSVKYKVYIIDEVHMLTREAFNALLKTLEEPPAHCIFILATTEVHKLPETIISRTQRFTFKPVDQKTAANHLSEIAKKEGINVTDKALELLAQHGQGSFRDSISLLDQLSSTKDKITEDKVREVVGLPPEQTVIDLMEDMNSGASAQLLEQLEALAAQGVNPTAIARELGKKLRIELISGSKQPWIPELLRQLLDVPASLSPLDSLEIALLEATSKNTSEGSSDQSKNIARTPDNNVKIRQPKVITKSQKVEVAAESIAEGAIADFDIAAWPQVVEYVKKHNASLYTALKLAKPYYSDATLTLNFQFPLHQKKVNQAQQKALVGQTIEHLTKSKVKIECAVNKKMFSTKEEAIEKEIPKVQKRAGSVEAINSIFGGAEMIES
jgi:DNA polymerase-3 subunit gamma/tau